MATATIRGVELVKAGKWNASTGPVEVTTEDLASIVEAYGDAGVDRPVIKLGHIDPRFDGEPALGWVANVRAKDGDPDTVVGDIVGIPAKLAEIMPTAYRRRSVEIAHGLRTAAGKTYRAALTGLALLGVSRPAVKGLADVLALYGAPPAEAERVDLVEFVDGVDDAAAVAWLAAARVEVVQLAEASGIPDDKVDAALARLDRLAGVHDTASIPHAVVDPAKADDDGTDQGPATAGATNGRKRMAKIKRDQVTAALAEASDDDVEAKLRELLGDDGTEDADKAKAAEAAEAAEAEKAKKDAADKVDEPKPNDDGTVTLTAAQLTALTQNASLGAAAHGELAEQRHARILDDAVRAGKITPPELEAWQTALTGDEPGTVTLLDKIQPRFNTEAAGHATTPATTQLSASEEAAWAAFESDTFGITDGSK
ncbi:hypothetical protein [Jiangella muralis]|uniref:hypothetical protein n=1 Tax=Jiangella muralis TaxID=702383 RepID=UPI00069E048D|nr:hypothetical protein [Jiangella muralis]